MLPSRKSAVVMCEDRPPPPAISLILRAGLAGCFIGHGAFGVITKAAWVPYFAVGGINEPWAWRLMPWIGAMDIFLGLLAWLWPCRALFAWMAAWAVWTALLRPLSGEPGWEFFERAGNFGVPIALLVIGGWRGGWMTTVRGIPHDLTVNSQRCLAWALRLATVSLLIGHAGNGFFLKKAALVHHYRTLGFHAPVAIAQWVGAFEFTLAAAVLFFPRPALLFSICVWKIASESLFLAAGAPVWELVERFGSFAAPLALAVLLTRARPPSASPIPERISSLHHA